MVAMRPFGSVGPVDVDVLIVGGGPAGLSAGAELGRRGVPVVLVDDRAAVGGKLVLQTHKFFGTKVRGMCRENRSETKRWMVIVINQYSRSFD